MRVHSSEAVTANSKLRALARRRGEGNVAWLERALGGNDDAVGDCSIVLLGGAGLTDFRLRVAQSGARSDLLPSFWSHTAILADRKQLTLHEVSLEPSGGFGNVPSTQGIRSGRFRAYDDPAVFPNVAVVHWKLTSPPEDISPRLAIDRVVARLSMDRGSIDILTPLWTWLGFVWGVGDHGFSSDHQSSDRTRCLQR